MPMDKLHSKSMMFGIISSFKAKSYQLSKNDVYEIICTWKKNKVINVFTKINFHDSAKISSLLKINIV